MPPAGPQGPIAQRAQGLIPITWDALLADPRVPIEGTLQAAIDLAKQNTFGSVISEAQELISPFIAIDYCAKLAVIEIARSGEDFWMNQAMSVSSSGTNENTSYIDRASKLEQTRAELITETRDMQMEVSKIVGYYIDNGRAVPQLSSATINPYHNTPSPEEFPREYRQTPYS
jgi:hypothetical protein